MDGKKLGTYIVTAFMSGYPGTLQLTMSSTNVYFAGKLIQSVNGAVVADRLGSVRQVPGAYPAVPERYYPYGDEYGAGTANDHAKFATYTRDGSTGLDYADQRYYTSQYGRFLTADQADANNHPATPLSWNRYTYADGDPINANDPSGAFTSWMAISGFCPVGVGESKMLVPCELLQIYENRANDALMTEWDLLGEECQNRLRAKYGHATIRSMLANLNRGLAMMDTIETAANAHGIDPSLLAAIGLKETGFTNIPQKCFAGVAWGYPKCSGAGIFQIDLYQNPSMSRSDAFDVSFAANWAANLLATKGCIGVQISESDGRSAATANSSVLQLRHEEHKRKSCHNRCWNNWRQLRHYRRSADAMFLRETMQRFNASLCTACLLFVVLDLLAIQNARASPPPVPETLTKFLQGFDDDRTTRYSAELVNLSGMGSREAIVYLVSKGWCGSGGCNTLILAQDHGSWKVVTNISITRPPVRVLNTVSSGWRDLSVWVEGGGIQPGYEAKLRFDGRTYPTNPSTPPAMRLDQTVAGEIIIPTKPALIPLYPEMPSARLPSRAEVTQPSFDCQKASTPTEKLICRDRELSSLDSVMAATYREVLQKVSANQKAIVRSRQAEWFSLYNRTCNSVDRDESRRACIVRFFSERTQELHSH